MNTACGQRRTALRNGMPACTPYPRASYDALVTTLRGVEGSEDPPTTTG
jgi:hypothetical protein